MNDAEDRSIFEKERDACRQLWIDTLSHTRHDYLNDLQLLLGYVQLRKYDKIAECVDMLKQRMAEDSRVSKLGHLGLVEALLTYRSRPKPFLFSLKIGEGVDLRDVPLQSAQAEQIVRAFLAGFEAAAVRGADGGNNRLEMAFDRRAKQLVIEFTYEGAYSARTVCETAATLRRASKRGDSNMLIEESYQEGKASVRVNIPAAG
jgi:stage 0 sporulation protein B (sporulation initiation phosphotransferase)